MILALGRGDFGYDLLLLLHILAVIVGFGSSFVWPFLGIAARDAGMAGKGELAASYNELALKTSKHVTTHAIWLSGLLGLVLAIMGDWMEEAWVGISIALFLAMVVFAGVVHVPNIAKLTALSRQLAGGPPPGAGAGGPPPQLAEMQARGKAAARNGGILHAGFFIILILMVWKP